MGRAQHAQGLLVLKLYPTSCLGPPLNKSGLSKSLLLQQIKQNSITCTRATKVICNLILLKTPFHPKLWSADFF